MTQICAHATRRSPTSLFPTSPIWRCGVLARHTLIGDVLDVHVRRTPIHEAVQNIHQDVLLRLPVGRAELRVIWDGSPIHRREWSPSWSPAQAQDLAGSPAGHAPDLNLWDEGGWHHLKHREMANLVSAIGKYCTSNSTSLLPDFDGSLIGCNLLCPGGIDPPTNLNSFAPRSVRSPGEWK